MTLPVGGEAHSRDSKPPPATLDEGIDQQHPARSGGVLQRAQITLFGSGLGGILAVVNEIVCARYLGVGSYGLYAFALVLARIAEAIATIGLPVATLHFISIYRDRKQPRLVLGTILASLLPPLLIGGTFTVLLLAFAPTLAQKVFGNARAVPFIQAMALAIPFMGLSEVLGVITRGFGHAAYYVVVRSLVPPVVFFGSLLLITSHAFDPHWVPAAFCLASVTAALTGIAAVLKVGGGELFRLKPQLPLRELYGYSFPVLLNILMYLVVACTPILLLSAMQSDTEVGIFRACMQLVIPFDMVVIAFNAAVGHLYPVLEHNNRRQELAALVERITRWMSTLALAMVLVIALNRHDLMRMMGPEFVAGANTLAVLALGHAVLCCVGSAGYLLVMSGRQRFETINAVLAAAFCVILNLSLIPSFGSLGAAVATALACLLVSVLRIFQVKRLMAIQVLRPSLLRIIALASFTAVAVFTVARYLPVGDGSGIPGLIMRNALIAALFIALYWFFGLDHKDRHAVVDAWHNYRRRSAVQR